MQRNLEKLVYNIPPARRRALRVESDAAGSSANPHSGRATETAAHTRRKRKSSRTPEKGKKMKLGDQRGTDVPSMKRKAKRSTARVSILLVSQEYCTSKGGISTINLSVARMIAATGAKVYATVLEASDQDEKDAQRDGVRLLKPRLDVDSSTKPSLEWLTVYHKHHFPHIPADICCIVGHVDVTSRAARKIKEERFPHAKLAMFGHVAPEETEHYKSDEKALGVGRKEASIQDDIGEADVVFSVGPRIHRHYDRFLQQRHVTHHIFLPEPSKVFCEAKVTFGKESKKVRKPERVVLSIGRVRNVERLKGHDLAAGSTDKAAQRLDNQYTLRLKVRGIDENDFKDSKRILEEKLRSGRVKPTLLPYGTQEEIRRDMENCHLVLMPSRAEPFGLVGLEAIAAGVPVLISEHSGLAELIEELSDRLGQPTFRHCIVKMTGDTATDADAEKWAERIEDVLKKSKSEFAEARAFREKLLASKYWEESHQTFLQACGITGNKTKRTDNTPFWQVDPRSPPGVSSRNKGEPLTARQVFTNGVLRDEPSPRVVLIHAAEDLDFVGRLVGELRYLSGNYSLPQTDISRQQVTGTPGDVSRAQLTSTLTLGSVKLVVPVISRHLLADQSSLTVGLETAVRNNKPRYVIWLDQNKDDFREFGTLVSRQYPTLEAPARRVQRDRIWETMPCSVVRGMLGIAWDMRGVICRQTGELRRPCWGALFHNRAFLSDNMNLSAVLTRLEQENQLSSDEVWDIEDNPLFVVFEPTPLRRGARLVEMLKERGRQEPYDWLVRVLREEGQDFLAEKMEEQERYWARQYGIGEQLAAEPGQKTEQREHFIQQSQGRKKRAYSAEGSDGGQSTPSEHGRPVRRQPVSSHIAGTRSYFQYIVAPYWKDLAFFLGFGSAAASNITHRNPDDESRYMDMLEEWEKMRGEEATTQVLKAALSEAGLQGVLRARGLTERAFPELADNSGSTDEPGEAGPSDSASEYIHIRVFRPRPKFLAINTDLVQPVDHRVTFCVFLNQWAKIQNIFRCKIVSISEA
uniref:Death domain-containing protein n=1 Tax=Branchiostoma floridae TaxID=7739 RepID=C3Y055_BRAFL|eukprot:XP_002610411.1 hypothetical protein BRAFLDRAFT_72365 [Branchiostoma floridae]